jgi:hypothetical protein
MIPHPALVHTENTILYLVGVNYFNATVAHPVLVYTEDAYRYGVMIPHFGLVQARPRGRRGGLAADGGVTRAAWWWNQRHNIICPCGGTEINVLSEYYGLPHPNKPGLCTAPHTNAKVVPCALCDYATMCVMERA